MGTDEKANEGIGLESGTSTAPLAGLFALERSSSSLTTGSGFDSSSSVLFAFTGSTPEPTEDTGLPNEIAGAFPPNETDGTIAGASAVLGAETVVEGAPKENARLLCLPLSSTFCLTGAEKENSGALFGASVAVPSEDPAPNATAGVETVGAPNENPIEGADCGLEADSALDGGAPKVKPDAEGA